MQWIQTFFITFHNIARWCILSKFWLVSWEIMYWSKKYFSFSHTDSELGKRRVGAWLRHVWAEGTDRCRSSFCSPLIWEFNSQEKTHAGLRRISSNTKTVRGTQQICPQSEITQSSNVYPWFMNLHPCRQTPCILFVLFSSDSCSVCDL